MKVSRTSRLNGEYQKEISEIIRRMKDRTPDLKGLVSVTEVDVAPDLKTAYVYVSIYGCTEEETKRSFAALQAGAGHIGIRDDASPTSPFPCLPLTPRKRGTTASHRMAKTALRIPCSHGSPRQILQKCTDRV